MAEIKNILVFSLLIILQHAYTQDWVVFNDTLVYYYQASNTGDYFTLRTKDIYEGPDETVIHFTDNYIVNDNYEALIFYSDNGSILGDSMRITGDTIWMDESVLFINNMEPGETSFYTADLDINYHGQTDSIVFGIDDSIRYFHISDGTRLVQSKNFGFLEYPKPFSDSMIVYSLVGIENYVGMSFNNHNAIFDFEIGDKFYYQIYFNSWMDDPSPGTTEFASMEVIDKFAIGGMNYYSVITHGGWNYYEIYPPLHPGNSRYDHPGERVIYCRASDLKAGTPDEWEDTYNMLDDNWAYHDNLGHRYDTTETGNLVQMVGFSSIEHVDYETFGNDIFFDGRDLFYVPFAEGLLQNDYWYEPNTFTIYEQGYGLTHFEYNRVETDYKKDLIGAIKSGDTLGYYFDLGINEAEESNFYTFPNPVQHTLNFDPELKNIQIYDNQGRLVFQQSEYTSSVKLIHFPAGIYLIKGEDTYGVMRYTRFLKE